MAKFTGKGAKFLIKSSGATPAYQEVGQVSAIGDVAVTADEVEVTTLDAGDYRDYIQGFKDPGECELTVIFDPGLADQGIDADGLIGLFTSGEVRDCAIRWNSSDTGGEAFGIFKAFIRDMTYNALNPDDPQTITPLFRLKTPITLVDTLPTTLTETETKVTAAQAEAEAARAAKAAATAKAGADRAAQAAIDRGQAAADAQRAADAAKAKAAQLAADECSQLAAQAAALTAATAQPTPPPA